MKKLLLLFVTLYLYQDATTQALFPIDNVSNKVSYKKIEIVTVPKVEMYNRTRTWFLNYYRTSKFEDYFRITKNGKPIHLVESKTANSITGKCGFYIMYPNDDRSGLNMEQTFIMFTLTVRFKDGTYESLITDFICFGAQTSKGNMRPPQFGLEAYNEGKLNDLDYVQQYVIPQVNNSVRKVQEELSRNIRLGNITGVY